MLFLSQLLTQLAKACSSVFSSTYLSLGVGSVVARAGVYVVEELACSAYLRPHDLSWLPERLQRHLNTLSNQLECTYMLKNPNSVSNKEKVRRVMCLV